VLRFCSVPYCTYDFHQTTPREAALVFDVGFRLSRFQKDFHLLLSAHAGRNPKRWPPASAVRQRRGVRLVVLSTLTTSRVRQGTQHPRPVGPNRSQPIATACISPEMANLSSFWSACGGSRGVARAKRVRRRLAAVAREVFVRDGKQCSYVSADGSRCTSRRCLELDHIDPWAHGGADTARNLRILCRTNQRYARHCFGQLHLQAARARKRRAQPTPNQPQNA
jgi:HNH endonuclease